MERFSKNVTISNKLLLAKGLTPTEKILLSLISELDVDGECLATNQFLANSLGLSKKHTSTLIQNLVRRGFLTSQVQNDSQFGSARRRLLPIEF